MPQASVIIPTYNYGSYINEAINSVLDQDYPSNEIEIIVVDDGSTDNTKQVLADLIQRKQIKYFFQENKGKANATKVAIKKSAGKYIFNLDADDYFLPNKISESIRIFESDLSIVHVATPAQVKNESSKVTDIEKLPQDILDTPLEGITLLKRFYNSNILFGGGTTFAAKGSILKEINIPDEVDMYIDEFLILAVLPYGKSFFLNEPLSIWRVHGMNYSGSNKNSDKKMLKARRLLNSSAAVLDFLESSGFDKEIIKIYRLQDATRRIAFAENLNKKTLKDIAAYAKDVFIEIKPGWHLVRYYNVLNRLIPSFIFRFLKNFKHTHNK